MSATFILVQHGHATNPADKAGTDEVARTAAYIEKRFKPDLLVSGPTERCMSTARIIGQRCGLTPIPEPALIPNCRTLDELSDRLFGIMTQLTNKHAGKTIVIVNHELSNQLIIARLMGISRCRDDDIAQEPCSVSCLRHHDDGDRWSIDSLNETAQLA